ncbi:MAG: TraR/DksA C4-type zinc finger protein [Gemmatimonadetes bacterium]|nr:TraR/DksA C4-type zinc finger protein [Gemmatimonadota bacterium]
MDHLTREQVATLTADLDRELRKLERSMRTTEEALRPVKLDQTAVGRLSRIDSLQNQGLTRNLQEREQAKLGQIVAAVQRVEAGTYGTCVECGGAIRFERLEVFPETPTCAACSP